MQAVRGKPAEDCELSGLARVETRAETPITTRFRQVGERSRQQPGQGGKTGGGERDLLGMAKESMITGRAITMEAARNSKAITKKGEGGKQKRPDKCEIPNRRDVRY